MAGGLNACGANSSSDAGAASCVCNAGYGKSADGECLPVCTAGISAINTSTGLSIPLFTEKHTSPALHVGYNNRVCYADLMTGRTADAININVGGQTYHIVQ